MIHAPKEKKHYRRKRRRIQPINMRCECGIYSVYGNCVLDLVECLPHTDVMISTKLPNYEENAQHDMLSEVIVTTKIRQIRFIKIIKQLMAVTNFTSSANGCFSLVSCSFFSS